jgi:hypothetical protein
MNINDIIKKCKTAAEIASKAALDQLEAHGPRFSIHEADLFGKTTSPSIGTMLDNCGGAYITLPGNCAFVRELKKIGKQNGSQHHYYSDLWSLSKGVYKGYTFHIRFDLQVRQEMAVHTAAMNAVSNVLNENTIPAKVRSYID